MLQLDRVTKRYKVGLFGGADLAAVRDVSFDVHRGEVVSLIGESGSGKTTIGRMILRLSPVTSGAVMFEGVDVAALKGDELKGYYRDVQGVFQDPFSCYNPIFKAGRVFSLLRDGFFSDVGDQEWTGAESDQAFALLEQALDERSSALVYLKVEPRFDNLRADPRYAQFLRRVGLIK